MEYKGTLNPLRPHCYSISSFNESKVFRVVGNLRKRRDLVELYLRKCFKNVSYVTLNEIFVS